MIKFKNLKKFVFHRIWAYLFMVIIVLLIINYANNSLVLTLRKNYTVKILTTDESTIFAQYNNMKTLYENQVLLDNRLMIIENKMDIKKNRSKSLKQI
jgi:hypothetical protein